MAPDVSISDQGFTMVCELVRREVIEVREMNSQVNETL